MLTGKMTKQTTFEADDHRSFNRHGEAFDMGETFSGVDYDVALAAVEELRKLVPPGASMSQFALRWILMFDAVTCAIPAGRAGAGGGQCQGLGPAAAFGRDNGCGESGFMTSGSKLGCIPGGKTAWDGNWGVPPSPPVLGKF